jgi:site-specific DNA recombinase
MARPENERSPTTLAHESARAQRMADFFEDRVTDPQMRGSPAMAHLILAVAVEMARKRGLGDLSIGRQRLAGWSQGNPASCRRKYVREEELEAQFSKLLGRLKFDDEVLDWVREALHASHADERSEHEEAIRRHRAEHKRLDDRIHTMYVDKLDGLVDSAFFEKMSNQWREEQTLCLREIERHQNADRSYLDEGVQLLELARNAQRLFAKQAPREKRRLLNFLLSNCTWHDGEVIATFRQPFDVLAETAVIASNVLVGDAVQRAKTEIWLGD